MAKYNEGFLSDFFGTLGKVVGAKWRDIAYMRTKGPSSNSSNTLAQQEQRAKFKTAIQFARRLSGLLKLGYANKAKRMTPRNAAVREILGTAISGFYPGYLIDYAKVLVSSGSLEAVDKAILSVSAGVLTWDWEPNTGQNEALATDLSVVAAYCPTRRQCIYKAYASKRDEGSALLNLTPFVGQQVYTWLFFVSEDRKSVSDSLYTGSLTIS